MQARTALGQLGLGKFLDYLTVLHHQKAIGQRRSYGDACVNAGGTLLGILGTIFAYRFSSTQQSATKNAIIGEMPSSAAM